MFCEYITNLSSIESLYTYVRGSDWDASQPTAFKVSLGRWLQLRIDFDSTAVRLLIKGH